MTKVNPNNVDEIKLDISSQDIFKSDTISFFIKKQSILMTFKIEISQFQTKVNPNNGSETKSDIFPWDIFKPDIIFHWL